jgi:hypothetical protein
VGMVVHRAARIAHIGHGGQVLLSETTSPLVQDELPEGISLLDLGRHREQRPYHQSLGRSYGATPADVNGSHRCGH